MLDMDEFRLRSHMAPFKRRKSQLLDLLRKELDKTCYVSFSAGKDSMVCAHACNAVMPGIPILMVDPGVPIHWTEGERNAWFDYARQHHWNLWRFSWNKYGSGTEKLDDDAYRAAVHKDMFADLEEWAISQGLTRKVMGLRAEESAVRRYSLGSDKGLSEKRICPISLWSYQDVWAYISTTGMPILGIYHALGPEARNGLVGRNGLRNGRMEYLRKHYPEAYRVAREIFSMEVK